MERLAGASLLFLCVWLICSAQVHSQTPCPTASISPPSGLSSTVYTLSGSFLNATSMSLSTTSLTITGFTVLTNTSNSIKFSLMGTATSTTIVYITLVPLANLNCSNISLPIELHRPLFIYPVLISSSQGSPGTIINLGGCFPNDCGDGSTNYTVSVVGMPNITVVPISTPSITSYMGRLSNYEAAAAGVVSLQINTPFNTLATGFSFVLVPRGNITSVSPRQGQKGTLVTITGINLIGIAGYGSSSPVQSPLLSSVTFGGIPVFSMISVSDNMIVVRINNGTPGATYDILVNTTQGSQNGPYTYLQGAWTQLADGVITTILPPSAQQGTNVTVCGQRLLGNGTYITSVSVAGLQSPSFTNVSNINGTDCLLATVPAAPQLPYSGTIVLQSDTMAIVQSQTVFRYAGIQSVSPSQGEQGTLVVISGFELLSGYSNVTPTVYLAGYAANVVYYNSTQVTVIAPVPTNASLNQVGGVVITIGNFSVSRNNSWTFLAPGVITGVTPAYGQYGTLLTVTGTQLLGYGSVITSVTVGGQTATSNVISYNSSVLILRAPNLPAVGFVSITITSDVSAVVSGVGVFEYRAGPGNILQVSPASGQRGTFVTITGSNLYGFGNSILNVTFGGVLAVIDGQTTPTNSSITVRVQSNNITAAQLVPITILSDTLAIVQSSFNWTYQVEGSIQYTIPSAQGQQGTRITILGTNLLGGGTSVQQVYLDGANATVVSANSTAITVLVGSLNFQNTSIYPGQIYIISNTGAMVSGGLFTLQVLGMITTVSPAQGRYGTYVTLTGSNFIGYGNFITSVTIAGVSATIVQYNTSWALVRAGPSGVGNGSVIITADTGATVTSATPFTYLQLGTINSVVPSSGTVNTSFIILGINLYILTSPIASITIGGSPATVTFQDPTAIVAIAGPAPSNASNATLVIYSVDGSFIVGQSLFTYLSLIVSVVGTSTGQVHVGTIITIRLPSQLNPSTCTVTLGGIAANIVGFNVSSSTVSVAAPRASVPGNYYADIVVQGGGLTARLAGGFMYLQEGVIYTVQPAAGQSGANITLQGTNLLGGGNYIVSASLSSSTVTNGNVTVVYSNNTFVQLLLTNNPSVSGTVNIVLTADTGAIITRLSGFTYVSPGRISTIAPSSGQNSTVVTITGSGLLQGSTLTAINVTLAGMPATILGQTDSQIMVQASPSANATTGPVVITLSSGAIISTANMTFQYLQQGAVQQIAPPRGTVGTVVNITGTNLLGGGTNAVSVQLAGSMTQVISASSRLVIVVVVQTAPNATLQPATLQITADTGAVLYTTQFVWTFYALGSISSVSPPSWQQGMLVNITGSSLIGVANFVNLCVLAGVNAAVVQMSNSSVICRAGTNTISASSNASLNSLSGPVQLQLDTGPTITSQQNYSYYVAYISSINVKSGNNGTIVSISGAGFLPNGTTVSSIFFGSTPVLSYVMLSNNQIVVQVGYFNPFTTTITTNITSMNTTSTNTTSSTNATSSTTVPSTITINFLSGAYLQLPNAWTYTPQGQVLGISSSFGVPGDTITITGQNLVPANTSSVQVILGQLPAYSTQVVNTSVIVFRVGPYQTQLTAGIGQLPTQPLPIQIIAPNGATVVSTNITFTFNQTGTISSVTPMAGENGSVVTITGAFLLGGNNLSSVTLAGVSATVIFQSDNTIIVVAGQSPARSGGVVIESGGRRLTGVSGTVWTYLPPLTAAQVSPLSGQNGTQVSINISSIPIQYAVQQVYLAGVQAVIQNTSTPLQVVVRAGPSAQTTGDIVVVFTNGTVLTIPGAWSYSPPVVILSLQTPVRYYNLSIPAGYYYNISGLYNVSGSNVTTGYNNTFVPAGYYSTLLNITGSGFQGGQGVPVISITLAGVGTTILSQSDTSLQLVISQFVNSTTGNLTGPIIITSSQNATYTSTVNFTYLQVQALASAVSPTSGQTGTVVNITGSGLLAGGTAITQFLLAGYPASITTGTDQLITVVASSPSVPTNTSNIAYTANTGAMVTIPSAWQYRSPGSIMQVSPAAGSYGTIITITGTGMLGGGTSLLSLSLASVPVASVQYSSDSFIQVVAGDGAAGSNGNIIITSNTGSTVASSAKFSYNPRGFVAAINPSSGQYGTTVTITGNSLYQVGLAGVTLAGFSATVVPGYNSSFIQVTASRPPAPGSYTGNVVIVSTDGTTTNSSNTTRVLQFNYLPEGTISTVSPSQGQYGTQVSISGLHLLGGGTSLATVLLGGVPAFIMSANDTLVNVVVFGTSIANSTGDIVLISNTNATIVSVGGWSYVPLGVVTSLSPSVGQYGTYLNITGVYLTAGGNTLSQVYIDSVLATIVSSSDTFVSVRAGLPTAQGQAFNGTVTLVSATGGIVFSTQVWTYLPGANVASIFPTNGTAGTNVTITGTQLLGGGGNTVVQVMVVGIPATNIQSNSIQVSFTVGPASDGQSRSGSIVLVSDTGAITNITNAWTYIKVCPFNTILKASGSCVPCSPECNGCYGLSDMQCLSCNNYRILSANGSLYRCVNKCPNLTTDGGLCVDTAGCSGPGVANCNPNTDPLLAGSGTIGITVAIIVMLALIVTILLVVVAYLNKTRKKQKYDVGTLEMLSVHADNSRNMVLWIAESATGPRKPLYVDSGMQKLCWPASPFPGNNDLQLYYMKNVTAYFVATPTSLGATTYYISTPAFKTFDSSSNNYMLAKLANVSGVTFQKNSTLPGVVMAEYRFLDAVTELAVDITKIISFTPIQVRISVSISGTTNYLYASNPGAQSGEVGLSASNSTTFFVQYMT